MESQILYRGLAPYYDLIYSQKDYVKEATILKEIIERHKASSGIDLLDVGCGTGHHLKHLGDDFACTGLDINGEMLEIASKNIEGAEFIEADMTTMSIGRRFDVITCLFSSIGYAKTYQNLGKTLRNFANHLKPGGLLLIEPWFTEDVYSVGAPFMTTYEDDDIKIARLNVSMKEGNVSVMEMHYLIAERDVGVRHYVGRHELGLFDTDRTLELMREAGFRASYTTEGTPSSRGLYIGIRGE
ncbi:class I SAM-dependent methyltransferase [Candidatus Bathyarchaeota archaeon]|nr:class I SAM-dependent methyltransferase [Candidatus Bathyarchaeota archaeon]